MDKCDYYVALITVTATEEAGLRHIYDDWKLLLLEGDEQRYYETSFERNGKTHKIVTARQNEMGMPAAGVLTMKMISIFKPKYVIMVGIAAGIAHKNAVDQIYGDVVVPDIVWDLSSRVYVTMQIKKNWISTRSSPHTRAHSLQRFCIKNI